MKHIWPKGVNKPTQLIINLMLKEYRDVKGWKKNAIAHMKEEGTYQTYLEISRKRTKAWRSRKHGLEPPPPPSPPPSAPKVEPEPEPMLPLHVPTLPLKGTVSR